MAFGDSAGDDGSVEADAVVGDAEHRRIGDLVQTHADRGGARVFVRVGKQFACGAVEQGLGLRPTDIVEVRDDIDVPALPISTDEFPHRGGESDLCQHLRMQGGDGGSQGSHRIAQCGLKPIESFVVRMITQLVEI